MSPWRFCVMISFVNHHYRSIGQFMLILTMCQSPLLYKSNNVLTIVDTANINDAHRHTERERESTLYWPHWPNYCMYECSFLRLSFVQFNFYLSTCARTNDIDDGNAFIYFLLLSIPNSTNIYLACVNIDFDWSWYKGIN